MSMAFRKGANSRKLVCKDVAMGEMSQRLIAKHSTDLKLVSSKSMLGLRNEGAEHD